MAVDTLITLQRPENRYATPLTELKKDLERLIKPPSYFRIRGIFQPHRVETEQQSELFRQQLIQEATDFFRPSDNNLIFLEDAYSDLHNNRDFYDAFATYKSALKAYAAARELKSLKQPAGSFGKLRSREREVFDELVDLQIQMLDIETQPNANPELAYFWSQLKIIDELIAKKYRIKIMFEQGTMTERPPIVTSETTSKELVKATLDLMRLMEVRGKSTADDIIASQLIDLEKSVNPNERTNVLMIFGSNHVRSIGKLPDRLRQVASISFKP